MTKFADQMVRHWSNPKTAARIFGEAARQAAGRSNLPPPDESDLSSSPSRFFGRQLSEIVESLTSGGVPIQEAKAEAERIKYGETDPARLKEAWGRDPSLRSEFFSFEDYQAYCLAVSRGQVGRLAEPRSLSHRKDGMGTSDKPYGRQVEIEEPVPGGPYNETKFAAQFDASTDLQKEFGDKASYLAYCRNMCRGGVRLARR